MDAPARLHQYTPEKLLGRPLNEVESKNAPSALFAQGDLPLVRRGVRVSIVGARKASQEGLRRSRKLAIELAREGVVVVSGLAAGVDTAAHLGAMSVPEGRTVGVIGTPLDQVYPASNRELQERIRRDHLLVTPFAPGSRIYRSNFPQRNRVMALISDATVIVEASDTSGSISQGWEAIRLGRHLFIMKSVAEAADLTWPEAMIRYGAQVLSETAALLEILPVESGVAEVAGVAF